MKKIMRCLALAAGFALASASAFAENVSFYFPSATCDGEPCKAWVVFDEGSLGSEYYNSDAGYGLCDILFEMGGKRYSLRTSLRYEHWTDTDDRGYAYEHYSVLTRSGQITGVLVYDYYQCEAEFRTQSWFYGYGTNFGKGCWEEEENE